jgi:hypothetical protein
MTWKDVDINFTSKKDQWVVEFTGEPNEIRLRSVWGKGEVLYASGHDGPKKSEHLVMTWKDVADNSFVEGRRLKKDRWVVETVNG